NFAVIDFFWDRLLGTFQAVDGADDPQGTTALRPSTNSSVSVSAPLPNAQTHPAPHRLPADDLREAVDVASVVSVPGIVGVAVQPAHLLSAGLAQWHDRTARRARHGQTQSPDAAAPGRTVESGGMSRLS